MQPFEKGAVNRFEMTDRDSVMSSSFRLKAGLRYMSS